MLENIDTEEELKKFILLEYEKQNTTNITLSVNQKEAIKFHSIIANSKIGYLTYDLEFPRFKDKEIYTGPLGGKIQLIRTK